MNLPAHQYERLADFFADVAQVSLASIAVPYLIDSFRPITACWGVAFTVFFWIMGLFFNRKAV